jgi:CRISPR-associated protein Csd2
MDKQLHHNIVKVPNGKNPQSAVAERHELVLLFDCKDSNPNGDPDTGNMPRIQPDTLKGLVTDVCVKRKVRNFFSLYCPEGQLKGDLSADTGYSIFIRENAVLEETLRSESVREEAARLFNARVAAKPALSQRVGDLLEGSPFSLKAKSGLSADKKKEANSLVKELGEPKECAFRDALCGMFVDVRSFGGVVSTEGPLKGSFYGQIRGPVQITFAESLDKVLQIDASITRCAEASAKEAEQHRKESAEGETEKESGHRTMGRKHSIDYGLYRCAIHISAAFAAKTGFSYYDLDNFFFALKNMFVEDHAAGRHLRLVGLVDFQHTSALGNAPAHKLFEMVKVEGIKETRDGRMVFKSSGSEFPQGLHDYCGSAPGGTERHESVPGYDERITARRIVWEIPECSSAIAT